MDSTTAKVCRLCLEIISSRYRPLDTFLQKMLHNIHHIDLTITRNPLICSECSTYLIEVSDFLNTHSANEEFVRAQLSLPQSATDFKQLIVISEEVIPTYDKKVCRTCLDVIHNNTYVSLVEDEDKNPDDNCAREIVNSCFPRLVIPNLTGIVVCETCLDSINKMYNLKKTCIEIEQRIKQHYCRMHNIAMDEKVMKLFLRMHSVKPIELIDVKRGSLNSNAVWQPSGSQATNGPKEKSNSKYLTTLAHELKEYLNIPVLQTNQRQNLDENLHTIVEVMEDTEKRQTDLKQAIKRPRQDESPNKENVSITISFPPLSKIKKTQLSIPSMLMTHFQLLSSDPAVDVNMPYYYSTKTLILELANVLEPYLEPPANSFPYLIQILIGMKILIGGKQMLARLSGTVDQLILKRVFMRFCQAISGLHSSYITLPLGSKAEMKAISDGFHDIAGIPNVIGAINTTSFYLALGEANSVPSINAKEDSYYKVQLVSDKNSLVTDCSIWPATWPEKRIWEECELNKRLNDYANTLAYVVGDSRYPSSQHLLAKIRFPKTPEEIAFNTAHKPTMHPLVGVHR